MPKVEIDSAQIKAYRSFSEKEVSVLKDAGCAVLLTEDGAVIRYQLDLDIFSLIGLDFLVGPTTTEEAKLCGELWKKLHE